MNNQEAHATFGITQRTEEEKNLKSHTTQKTKKMNKTPRITRERERERERPRARARARERARGKTIPTITGGIQVLAKCKYFLILINHPPFYS